MPLHIIDYRGDTVDKNEELLPDTHNNNFDDIILMNLTLDKLSQRQKYIIQQIYMNGYSEKTLASKLNVTPQAICKTKKKTLDNLRGYLN